MKRTLTTFLLAGIAPVAGAHTLDPSGGLVTAISHELLGVHHLPMTLIVVAIGVAWYRSRKKKT